MVQMTRRALGLGVISAASCAGQPKPSTTSQRTDHTRLRGREAFSESAALVALTQDARLGISLRLCRYPSEGVTWMWADLFQVDRHLGRYEDQWPHPSVFTSIHDHNTTYAAESGNEHASFLRVGERNAPTSVEMSFRVGMRHGANPGYGPGRSEARFTAQFTPLAAAAPILDGRMELAGHVVVQGVLEGQSVRFEAFGKWHEQQQTRPRFGEPFCYLSCSGPDLHVVAVRGRDGAAGNMISDGLALPVRSFKIAPPSGTRRWEIQTEALGADCGELHVIQRYWQPIYDQRRLSTIVSGIIGSRPVSGFVNDWMPSNLAYDSVGDSCTGPH